MSYGCTTVCRGDRKIYFNLIVKGSPSPGSIDVFAEAPDRTKIPISIHPKIKNKPDSMSGDSKAHLNQTEYVITLPDLLVPKARITLSLDGKAVKEQTVFFEILKWKSRLNYRIKRRECLEIRDFDRISRPSKASVEFQELIFAGESNILRMAVRIPYRQDNQVRLFCTTSHLQPLETNEIVMGDSVIEDPSSETRTREILYSIRIPAEQQTLIFSVEDENHPQLNSFEVLSAERYGHLSSLTSSITKNAQIDRDYPLWFEEHRAGVDMLSKQMSTYLDYRPEFSIVVPLYRTPLFFFEEMLESVKKQTYGRWQLILVNASPEDEPLLSAAQEAATNDRRITLVNLDSNLGISENTNEGVRRATGDFVCFFDHDDVLEPNLLFEYAQAINNRPDVDALYCDEDKLMPDGSFAQPFLKPDFSIDLLRNNNYICHMLAIRKSLYDVLEPNTKEFDGAQDHNLALQASEKARYIHHVPKVLYHWRISDNSTAANANSKPYATLAGIKAVKNHLCRMGITAEVAQSRRPFTYKISYPIPKDKPLVSIIIPSKDHIDLLDRCLKSILDKTTYQNFEIVIIENNSTDERTFDYYERITGEHPGVIRVCRWSAEFNFSKLMNFGASEARGDYLLLLNNDTEVISPHWISSMLGLAAREEVGIVGVRLYYPDDTIQHAGVCVTGGAAGHLGKNLAKGNWGYFALHDAEQNLSAVTAACMMTKREVFEKVGGWTEELSVAFNDIDFCLKAREQGYLVVYTPEVELYHHESISRGYEDNVEKRIRFHREVAYINHRWAPYYVKGDPYINPNITKEEPMNCYYHL